ncbi:MAG: type III ribulose-bisphosphate carboxylase [Candidatus Aenigmarchaeota archaeon]|nr:type III ribulose-bisphosphate carboxylase [Candidatus Aenigmarchaeota archaeon]
MGYMHLGYEPRNDVVCEFYFEHASGVSAKIAAENIAAESSIGTWVDVPGTKKQLGAKVFSIKNNIVKIAYPLDLFEPGNVPQLLSSVAGNVFGMKILKNLRLNDISFPKKYIRSFKGPNIGLNDLRKMTGIKKRPLIGTIYKPKLGLSPGEMEKLAYKVYSNGIDYTKDDENLGSMRFNKFEDRVIKVLNVVDEIKSEQGRQVVYAANITASTDEMLRRAEFVKDHGGKCIMIDILTAGWSGLQTIRNQNFKMIIHAHRASHGAFTHNPKHGISMKVIAKLSRLVGVTGLHTGAVVGKMKGDEREIVEIDNFLRSEWYGLKKTIPIASGGVYPGLIPKIIKILGNDIIINCGGGLWGHSMGAEAGAKAMRQAVDATMEGISLKEYAKDHGELKLAIKQWGC